jgi:hypothetical protein
VFLFAEQFRTEQDRTRASVYEALKALIEKVRRIVYQACDQDLSDFLVNNGFQTNLKV